MDEDSDFEESADESEQAVEQALSEESDASTLAIITDPVIQSDSDSSTSAL